MSRAEEIRAKAARLRERRAAPEEQPPATTPRVRAKAIRKTVDLPPQRYSDLTKWCAETAVELGVSRITGQDVLNALVAQLLTDETLAGRIRDKLDKEIREHPRRGQRS